MQSRRKQVTWLWIWWRFLFKERAPNMLYQEPFVIRRISSIQWRYETCIPSGQNIKRPGRCKHSMAEESAKINKFFWKNFILSRTGPVESIETRQTWNTQEDYPSSKQQRKGTYSRYRVLSCFTFLPSFQNTVVFCMFHLCLVSVPFICPFLLETKGKSFFKT